MHKIGTMQGRLLPMVGDRIQAFPGPGWEKEFFLARDIGYEAIELTVEMASYAVHPVRNRAGRNRLDHLVGETGVGLAGLCCDLFMERPLTTTDPEASAAASDILAELVRNASEAGLPMIEIPAMGDNTLKGAGNRGRARKLIENVLPLTEDAGIDLVMESDLPPSDLLRFVESIGHPRFGINYDTGNSTWFGFDPDDEFTAYHQHIRNVHIKDCTVADYSVPLGQGETAFVRVFQLLQQHAYKGDFVLQAARQEDDLAAGCRYLQFTRNLVKTWLQ